MTLQQRTVLALESHKSAQLNYRWVIKFLFIYMCRNLHLESRWASSPDNVCTLFPKCNRNQELRVRQAADHLPLVFTVQSNSPMTHLTFNFIFFNFRRPTLEASRRIGAKSGWARTPRGWTLEKQQYGRCPTKQLAAFARQILRSTLLLSWHQHWHPIRVPEDCAKLILLVDILHWSHVRECDRRSADNAASRTHYDILPRNLLFAYFHTSFLLVLVSFIESFHTLKLEDLIIRTISGIDQPTKPSKTIVALTLCSSFSYSSSN